MKYEAGDRVKIKSLDWYNENKNQFGRVNCGSKSYTIEMCFFCGKTLTIQAIGLDFYLMEEDNLGYEFTDEMIEGLVEEPVLSAPNITEGVYIHEKDMKWTTEYILPDGYIFKDENGNVINATKIILEKKKKEYPKTFMKCCEVLSLGEDSRLYTKGYKASLIQNFQKLIICRDAYWKIAGEEMGLGKPWEPDWTNLECDKFCIWVDVGDIILRDVLRCQHILAFPTKEMRDAFYENFKELIEQCKELL